MEGLGHQKPEDIAIIRKEAGRFILATNLVDDEKLKPEEIITNYKNQQSCERGFRFLKDPLFFTDSFFVENPERIETMLFLMSLCLLVYNLGQRELRNSLRRAKVGVKNQLGKLTSRPTLRWIFQCFQGIHLLTLDGVEQIVNLTESRHYILNFLPSSCQKYYLISEYKQQYKRIIIYQISDGSANRPSNFYCLDKLFYHKKNLSKSIDYSKLDCFSVIFLILLIFCVFINCSFLYFNLKCGIWGK